jgi:hypothetical protein
MLRLTRSVDHRSGTDQRRGERRRSVLPTTTEQLRARHLVIVYMLVVAILICDVLLSLGVAITSLYLVPVTFLALWSPPKQSAPVLLLVAVCIVLTAVGFVLSPPGPVWVAMANRLFSVTIIVLTTVLSLLRKRTEDEIKVLSGLLPICAYCKKIRDDEGFWQQVERYISVRSEADFSHGMCPDCGPKHFPDIYADKPGTVMPQGLGDRQNQSEDREKRSS